MKIAILTSPNQWFIKYVDILNKKLGNSKIYYDHKKISDTYDVVFILSYHRIIEKEYLNKHKHNIVIHASDLPKGKGWAPMFWQVIEGKDKIPFTMFEASSGVDNGHIYMKDTLTLTGYELHEELRRKQSSFTIEMCLKFIYEYNKYKNPREQSGKESFYKKRTSLDSEININKTIYEQFNLLRTVNNDDYPAFFYIEGKKYILKIEELEDNNENR